MRLTRRFLVGTALLIVTVTFGPWALNRLYFAKIPSKNDISLGATQKLVAQNIGSSSSKAQVESWLKSQKIQYVYASSKEEDFNYSSPAVDSGIPIKVIGGIIFAKIPNAERGIIAKWDIKLVFFFGKNGKLLKYTVDKTSTGF